MRTVSVLLWGQLKLLAQTDSVSLTISEPYGVEDAIRSLVDSHTALKALLVNEDGTWGKSILVFVNGAQWSWDREKSLEEGAEITLMSPIAGGQG
jgi:molybdopterin converting factor small subunit